MKRGVFLNKILIISFIIFIFSLITFLVVNYTRKPLSGLKINFIGPSEVNPLENYKYTFYFENGSKQKLKEVNLKIFLSDGAFFKENPKEKEMALFLGDIEPQKNYEQNFDLFFLNEGGLRENVKIVVNYKLGARGDIFEKDENFLVLVKNPPLKTQIFIPDKVYVNQQFQASFRIINLTKEKLSNIKVNLETPSGFVLNSSFPPSENYYWEFSSLNPSETKIISLIGQIQTTKSNSLFGVKVDFDFQNQSFSLTKEIVKLNVLESPVVFNIETTPSNQSVPIGSNLYYEITLENRSQSLLENGEVRVLFSGPFDLFSLNSDGYFSQLDQSLSWNARNKEELLNLKPGEKVKFNFSLSLYSSYPILGEKNKDLTAKIRVEFRTPTIPVEIETGGKEYFVFQEVEKKIMGRIEAFQELVYRDNYFPGSGPLPLAPNVPTTLAWHIKIKTIGEDFNNFTLQTKLPLGVNLTGKAGGDAILENLKFNSKTGAFIYSLNKLPANLGYLEKEMDLVFEVVVVLPANTEIRNFVIIPSVQYSAFGSFSQTQINDSFREISASQILL